jgi:hypothetical protein
MNVTMYLSGQTTRHLKDFFTVRGSGTRLSMHDAFCVCPHVQVTNVDIPLGGQLFTQMYKQSIITEAHTTFGSFITSQILVGIKTGNHFIWCGGFLFRGAITFCSFHSLVQKDLQSAYPGLVDEV